MELFDLLIFGAVFYYIAQAVRRAASSQKDKRPPGSIAHEEGQSLTWAERTQRALEGAMEWEQEQGRLKDEADVRAEIEAMRAAERQTRSPWRHARDEQRRTLEAADDPSLSDALAGVAAMLDQRAASAHRAQPDEPFQLPAVRRSGGISPRDRPAPVARRETTSATRRPPEEPGTAGIEVEAQRVRDSGVQRRAVRPTMSEIPGLVRLTPMQRAIVYGEIFGRPVALGGGVDDSPD